MRRTRGGAESALGEARRKLSSILIVGGGVSGLVCAWRLARAGHDVEVLEREQTPGGRMRSEVHGDFVLERGAQFVTSGYRNLHGVAGALGLGDRIRPLPLSNNAVAWEGKLYPADSLLGMLGSPLLSSGRKLGLGKLALELFRHRSLLDPLQPERASSLDRQDAASYLANTVGVDARDRLLGPLISGTFDCELEDLSAAFLLLVLRQALAGPKLQSIEGGLGEFTQALAWEVPVRLGCDVRCILSETDGARVRYESGGREHTAVADAVVVAIPGPLVPGLCPKLTPIERGFFESVDYVRGTIVHLLLEKPIPDLEYFGVSFPRAENSDLYALCVDQHRVGAAPPGAGLINVALTEEAALRTWDAPESAVIEMVLDSLLRAPIGLLSPAQAVVHRWPLMLPRLGTGSLIRLSSFLRRNDRSPRLSFAGDYLIGPNLEAAVTSGMRAASDVARSLDIAR